MARQKQIAGAWITDAQALDDPAGLRSELKILEKTPPVASFLSARSNISTVIVGPKGFGKTFVLKAKRLQLQDEYYLCLPRSPIVDRPSAIIPDLSDTKLDSLLESDTWTDIWCQAFLIAVLKNDENSDDIRYITKKIDSLALKNILQDRTAINPMQILHSIVRVAEHGNLSDIIYWTPDIINPVTGLHEKIAIFVDSIDEYVDGIFRSPSQTHRIRERNMIWHNAQIGAWRAVRLLQGVNSHLKIFVSVRKESYFFAKSRGTQFANLDACALRLEYSRAELTKIIENNVRVDPQKADQNNSDPAAQFVGEQSRRIVNLGTGEVEDLFDYWLRHCIDRPRDVVTIGKNISNIDIIERTSAKVRDRIHAASADLVETLFTECGAHVVGFDTSILPDVIESNVLTKQQIEEASEKYARMLLQKHPGDADKLNGAHNHIFCILYSLGLIGVLQNDGGSVRQQFGEFGRFAFGKQNILPKATHYLIHPALSDFIIRRNATFETSLNRFNIIGQGMPWKNEDDYVYLIRGDIRHYREKMKLAGNAQTFGKFWKNTVDQIMDSLSVKYYKRGEGDVVMIADPSPWKAINACRQLSKALLVSKYNMKIRFVMHCDFWIVEVGDGGETIADLPSICGRIEKFAEPGEILLSEQVRVNMVDHGLSDELKRLCSFRSTNAEMLDDGAVKIGKPHEPDEYLKLWRLPLTSA